VKSTWPDADINQQVSPPVTATRRQRRTARRLAKWDSPPERGGWRYAIGTLGKGLIALGLLMFGFIAYLLWGTGFETARAQRELTERFTETLESTPTATAPAGDSHTADLGIDDETATGGDAGSTGINRPDTDDPNIADPNTAGPAPQELGVDQGIGPIAIGEPVTRLEIPSLGLDEIVVAGVGIGELKLGPGHFPETPLPGQYGRASIAGHRTTYGQPFRHIDRLEPGDLMITTTQAGRFVYEVTDSMVVMPNDYHVVNTTFPEFANLTLVSCHPAFSSSRRLVVNGLLVAELSDPIGRSQPYGLGPTPDGLPDERSDDTSDAESDPQPPTEVSEVVVSDQDSDGAGSIGTGDGPGDGSGSPAVGGAATLDDAFGDGWFDDPDAPAQVALWGAILGLIGVIGFLISRSARRDLVGFAVAIVPFGVAGFFFFQNVHRLLPAGL